MLHRQPEERHYVDTHGINCEVCLHVALETMQMSNAGARVADIRKFIEAKYASSFPGHTPTPMPPSGKGF